MDLKKEKKLKSWLWNVSKVAAIGYFTIKGLLLLSEALGLTGGDDPAEMAKAATAKLEIEDNVFSWNEDYRKAVLRIKNYAALEAQNVEAQVFAHYGKSIDIINFNKGKFINPNSFVALESDLESLPLGKLPDSITVCLVYHSENTEVKTWNQFKLKGVNTVLTKPLFGQVTYKVSLSQKMNFKDEVPDCLRDIGDFTFTTDAVRAQRKDSLAQIKQIKQAAQSFLLGLNHKDLSQIAQYATKPLAEALRTRARRFDYDFSMDIEVRGHNSEQAYVQVFVSSKGESNRILKDFVNAMQNTNTSSDAFFDFLAIEGGFTYIGKLKKVEGQWKFGIHEKSALSRK